MCYSMLEAVDGRLCSLEVPEVIRCVLSVAGGGGGDAPCALYTSLLPEADFPLLISAFDYPIRWSKGANTCKPS